MSFVMARLDIANWIFIQNPLGLKRSAENAPLNADNANAPTGTCLPSWFSGYVSS